MPMYENNALTQVTQVQNEGRILKKIITVHIPKHFKCANILQSKPISCPRQENVLCIYINLKNQKQQNKNKRGKTRSSKKQSVLFYIWIRKKVHVYLFSVPHKLIKTTAAATPSKTMDRDELMGEELSRSAKSCHGDQVPFALISLSTETHHCYAHIRLGWDACVCGWVWPWWINGFTCHCKHLGLSWEGTP